MNYIIKTKAKFASGLILLLLLNSCNIKEELEKQEHTRPYEVMYDPSEYNHILICPICRTDQRYFYKLQNNDIALLCEGCASMWLNPAKIAKEDRATDSSLAESFGWHIIPSLVASQGADWAVEAAVKTSPWYDLNNPLPCISDLIRNNN